MVRRALIRKLDPSCENSRGFRENQLGWLLSTRKLISSFIHPKFFQLACLLFSLCARQHICIFMWHPWLYRNGQNLFSAFKVTARRGGSQGEVELQQHKSRVLERSDEGGALKPQGKALHPAGLWGLGQASREGGVCFRSGSCPSEGWRTGVEVTFPAEDAHRWAGEACLGCD